MVCFTLVLPMTWREPLSNFKSKGQRSENTYTHRQKLSNSKLVVTIKKCFVPKYWKFKFYYLHLTSFEWSISVTEQMYYVTSVKAGIYWSGMCFFTVWVWHCVKGSYLNLILRSSELSEGNRFLFMENSERVDITERTHIVKYRSNIWHNLFNNEACQKALNVQNVYINRKCSLAPMILKKN